MLAKAPSGQSNPLQNAGLSTVTGPCDTGTSSDVLPCLTQRGCSYQPQSLCWPLAPKTLPWGTERWWGRPGSSLLLHTATGGLSATIASTRKIFAFGKNVISIENIYNCVPLITLRLSTAHIFLLLRRKCCVKGPTPSLPGTASFPGAFRHLLILATHLGITQSAMDTGNVQISGRKREQLMKWEERSFISRICSIRISEGISSYWWSCLFCLFQCLTSLSVFSCGSWVPRCELRVTSLTLVYSNNNTFCFVH